NSATRRERSVVAGVLHDVMVAGVADEGGVPHLGDGGPEIELQSPAVDGGDSLIGDRDIARETAAPVVDIGEGRCGVEWVRNRGRDGNGGITVEGAPCRLDRGRAGCRGGGVEAGRAHNTTAEHRPGEGRLTSNGVAKLVVGSGAELLAGTRDD